MRNKNKKNQNDPKSSPTRPEIAVIQGDDDQKKFDDALSKWIYGRVTYRHLYNLVPMQSVSLIQSIVERLTTRQSRKSRRAV